MTLPAAVDRLWHAAHQLRDDAQALRLHAVEDRPQRRDEAPSKLVENIETASLTLAGWVEEILDAVAQAVAASAHPVDLARLRHALGACADGAERVAAQLTEELTCSRRLDELNEFACGGREQHAWVAAIKDAVDRVSPSAWAVSFALTDCWRELAERPPSGGTLTVPIAPDTPEDSERRS
jgi:predicted metal-dependent phosphoesterase TrpH